MENNAHKEIKVYGTLLNLTINTNSNGTQSDLVDNTHNDYLTVAYQLYDERFSPKKGSGANFAVTAIDRYQDIINKRLTAIDYDPNGDTTNIYSNLYVDGDTNIGGDLTVEGDTVFKGDVNITGDINLDMGLNDLNDVTLSTMAIGQVLRYDGSKWVNAKLSLSDILMPAASNGLVLKFNGTEWVAAEDETGGGGSIPSGDNYPTLKKYRVKMNLIATCVPSVMADMSENDSIVKSQDCTTYLYKSENDINIGLSEIVLASGIESFNNDKHYVKYFAESAQSLLLSYGKINYTDDTVNGSSVNANNSFNRYLIAPSIQQSATTDDVLYINSWYYSQFYFDYFSKNNKTLRQLGNNKDVYIAPSCGFPYLYSSCIRPSNNLVLQGYADISHVTIENGRYVAYRAVKDYEGRYSGLLTGPYYKQVYNNDKHDVDGYTHITSTITNISESEFRNNVKWSNGETFIHIPEKRPFAILTESSNIQMPDYIYGYITTIS